MSTLVFLVRLILLSIAFILIHNSSSNATKSSMSSSNSLVLSLTRSSISTTHEFPPGRRRGRRTLEEDLSMPLTELPYAFMMSLALGTPPQVVHNNIFDTGSDLVWVPCGSETSIFNCIDCGDYERDPSSIFNPKKSHSIKRESCSSDLCVNIHVSFAGNYDTCTMIGCSLGRIVNGTCSWPCPSFAYTYGTGAVAGILATDILDTTNDHHYSPSTKNTSTPMINITFGCAHSSQGLPTGTAGFGKGPLSLPSQLGFLSKGFSHCFLPYQFSYNTNVSTPLILGDEAISSSKDEPFQYTPMLSNPHPLYQIFYYVGLESITVGTNTTIQAPKSLRGFDSWGDGGMMVDSGTTYTRLPEKLYWKLISILKSIVKHPRAKEVEQHSPFDLCYVVPVKGNDSLGLADDLPSLTFHFLGGASLALPHGNTFYRTRRIVNGSVVKCFIFRALDDAEPDCDAIFGNAQQLNVKVVYDLKKERLGFLPTDCLAYAQTHKT